MLTDLPKVFNLSEHSSIASEYLYYLRSEKHQRDRLHFRRNMRRIGVLLGYEISKSLSYKSVEVETPLAKTEAKILADEIVISPILRAGLAIYEGLLEVFDRANITFVGSYRKEENPDGELEIAVDYLSVSPLKDRVLIMCDPMLASGSSMLTALKALVRPEDRPKSIHVLCLIATKYGIEKLRSFSQNIHIWCAALDPELNVYKHIVPGLGDAGDLAYGNKR